MKKTLCACILCGNEEVHPDGVDGIRCICGGKFDPLSFVDGPISRRENVNKVVIKLTSADKAPVVTINGNRVLVANLNLNYKTDTDEYGVHDFSMNYAEGECINSTGFKRR